MESEKKQEKEGLSAREKDGPRGGADFEVLEPQANRRELVVSGEVGMRVRKISSADGVKKPRDDGDSRSLHVTFQSTVRGNLPHSSSGRTRAGLKPLADNHRLEFCGLTACMVLVYYFTFLSAGVSLTSVFSFMRS